LRARATSQGRRKSTRLISAARCLTLLYPKITQAILSGRIKDGLGLAGLLEPFPVRSREHEAAFLG
jgi:hypothetical protein